MLPYFEQPAWHIGPLTIYAFGIAVAFAMWFGLTMIHRQFERDALEPIFGRRLGGWMIVGGMLGAHLFSAVFYFPHKLHDDPWYILRFWEDISSFGGILGGLAGAYLFVRIELRRSDWRLVLRYLDAIAFVFPAALAIGRVGCAFAHDHPGAVTTFPLAVSLETEAARTYMGQVYNAAGMSLPSAAQGMGFHDLGLYEFLFLSFLVVPVFIRWHRQRRSPGFYLIAFAAIYLPVRFGFDMLRVSDARYFALTPAQWVAALIMTALPFAAVRQRKLRFAISGAIILATACACWGGA